MCAKYQQIIKDEVHKQKLTVRAAMGQKSYLRRMSSNNWSRPWMDYDLANVLEEALEFSTNKVVKSRILDLVTTLRDNHREDLSMYTKQRYDKEGVYSNVDNFFTSQKPNFTWNDNYKVGRHILRSILHSTFTGYLKSLEIRDNMDLTDILSTDDTAMGYLLLDSKKKDNPTLLINTAKRLIAEKPLDGSIYAVYVRNQISGGVDKDRGKLTPESLKHKPRAVMGVDGAMSLAEAIIAKPFTEHVFSKVQQYAGAKSPDEIGHTLNQWFRQAAQWTSTDYSKYDQNVPSWIIQDMFELIKEFFNSKEDKDVIDWLCYNFIHSKILYHDGSVRQKHKGISSGSQFTQIIGSLVNIQMILTFLAADTKNELRIRGTFTDKCWRRLYFILVGKPAPRFVSMMDWRKIRMMAMGDDNIFFLSKQLSRDALALYIRHNFGVPVSAEKTEQQGKNDCFYPQFLKREWRPEGAYRNVYELILNMLLAERERLYDGYTPWEILYGYTITYPCAFSRLWTEHDIVSMMGGVRSLENLTSKHLRDLPGSLRVLLLSRPQYMRNRLSKAKRYLAS